MTNEESKSAIDLGLQEILKSLEPSAPTIPAAAPDQAQEVALVLDPVADETISIEPPSALEEKLHHISTQLEGAEMSEVLLTPLFHECLSVVILSEKERRLLFSVGNALIARLSDKKEFSLAASLVRQLMSKEGGAEHASLYRTFCRRALETMSNRSLSPQEMKESLEYHDLLKLLPAEQNEMTFAASVVSPEPSVKKDPAPSPSPVVSRFSERGRYAALLVVLVLSVFAWFLLARSYEGDLADSFRESSQSTLVSSLDAERDEVSNLDALLYNVQEDEQRVASTALPEQAVPTPRPTPLLPQPRVTIDTNGPYEPQKVEEILDGKHGSVYERVPQQQEPSLRDDPRDTRPLADRDPPSRPGRFETGVRYEVMINTSVFDRPSFNAKEVEELMVGDRVRVEARLGRWLKIRSRNGEPGYIMSQDAQKLFD
jgi:hypothetical protein